MKGEILSKEQHRRPREGQLKATIRLLVGEEVNYTLISPPAPTTTGLSLGFFNIARSQSVVHLNHSRAQTSRLSKLHIPWASEPRHLKTIK